MATLLCTATSEEVVSMDCFLGTRVHSWSNAVAIHTFETLLSADIQAYTEIDPMRRRGSVAYHGDIFLSTLFMLPLQLFMSCSCIT